MQSGELAGIVCTRLVGGKVVEQLVAALVDVVCEVRFADLGDVALFDADPVQKLVAAFRQNRGGVVLPLGELQPP